MLQILQLVRGHWLSALYRQHTLKEQKTTSPPLLLSKETSAIDW